MSSEHFRQIESDLDKVAQLLEEGLRGLVSDGLEKPEAEAITRAKRAAERGAELARRASGLT